MDEDSTDVFNDTQKIELPYTKYLLLRAGHSLDLYQGVPSNIQIKTTKKDRKLVVAGSSKSAVGNFSKFLMEYRTPSAYTGRGVRVKKVKPVRKAGKKDKQKGKVF